MVRKLNLKKVLLVLLVVCVGMIFGTKQAEALEKKSMFMNFNNKSMALCPDGNNPIYKEFIINTDYKGAELVDAKAVKSNVAMAWVSTDGALIISPKKVGKTKIQLTAKAGKKTEKSQMTLTVYKYQNPASSYKIGNTQYRSKFNKKTSISTKKWKKGKQVSVEIKAKKGYHINSITYYYMDSKKQSKSIPVKNGGKVKIRGKHSSVQVNFYNKKRKSVENLCVWFE